MHLVPKRLLLVGAAPLAIAALYGGSLAFAQSGEPATPTPDNGTPAQDAAPTAPTTPGNGKDCPPGAGSDSEQSSGTGGLTQLRNRGQHGGATLY